MNRTRYTSQKGFSILVALGTTGVLLILALGLANVFIGEIQINKMVYDGIIAYSAAESSFEYGMLKAKNHRDGFQDKITRSDIDSDIPAGSTPRTKDVKITYDMSSQADSAQFTLVGGEYLILPLFVGDGPYLATLNSKNPNFSSLSTPITTLKIDGLDSDTSWTILGMSGGVTVGISGTGKIDSVLGTKGVMRNSATDCFGDVGGDIQKVDCNGITPIVDRTEYFYDTDVLVSDFLASTDITDRYISVYYNKDPATSTPLSLQVATTGKFSLPQFKLTTTGKVGRTAQSIEYTEDKSRYYDALKYSLYNQ